MNAKQRFRETMLFGNPDRIPMFLDAPRESTLVVWKEQGMPDNVDYMEALFGTYGISTDASLKLNWIDAKLSLVPEYETKILEHKDGHYVIRDWMGAITEISDSFDESYLRSAKDFVTRKWHKFPVETREDWLEMKARYNPESVVRFSVDFQKKCETYKITDDITALMIGGVFWQLREWCGFENLCILMMDDPDFVHEMADFWADFVSIMLEKVLAKITPDLIYINEDMAYKGNSMISPRMTREFIKPAYKRWISSAKKSGCSIILVDSDGYIGELIPIWIESGINCCAPIEVAANCDVLEFRRKFGKSMAYMGGIDKRIIAKGGYGLEKHVMSIVPGMLKEGGYIPGCDHAIPPDVSWQNFLEFGRMIAKLSGWL